MSISVYKYRTITEINLNTLFNNQIYASSSKDLNDPYEMSINTSDLLRNLCNLRGFNDLESQCIQNWTKIIVNARKRYGIYSLSADAYNLLLWAHYAHSHQGFCIEYDYNLLMDCLLRVKGDLEYDCIAGFKVDYRASPSKLTIDNILKKANNSIEILKDVSGIKSEEWKYENEVRIVFNSYGSKNIISEAITGIYFGALMRDSDKKKIIENLHINNIQYFQMQIEPNSYVLKSYQY